MAHRWQAHPRRRTSRLAWFGLPAVIGSLAVLSAAALSGSIVVARSGGSALPAPSSTPARARMPATASTDLTLPEGSPLAVAPGPAEGVASAMLPAKPRIELPDVAPIVLTTAGRGSTAVFLGDSYTSGFQGAGIGPNGWPQIVGRQRGWHVVNYAVPGTGFLNPGWTGQPVGSLVSRAIARHPDVVVIAAGHNDSGWSPSATELAADRVIARIRQALPAALLVVVGPIWQDGSPPARCLALRDHLRGTAASSGAVFVDPIGERWFAGSRHAMIRADGIHPSDAGHRWIASRVLAALARSDV